MKSKWQYETAFSRNIGLLTEAEQARVKSVKISIAGMGGVGGSHLISLVRQGFTRFAIADFDTFEIQNSNRQYGCFQQYYGHNKARIMAQIAREINPELEIDVFESPIDESNVDLFLKDAVIYIDGIDAFEIKARRLIFRKSYEQKIYAMTFGPLGFGTAWVNFSYNHMSFDEYFGFKDHQSDEEQFIRFITGLSPAGLHVSYIDPQYVDLKNKRGPSSILGCQLSSAVMVAEVLKIILNKKIYFAPNYFQFDAIKYKFKKGTLWFGARNPYLYLKRRIVTHLLRNRSNLTKSEPHV